MSKETLVIPSVEHWLTLMPESKRKQIMKDVDKCPHDCFHCYWFTFKEKQSQNRGCQKPGKLNIKWVVPEAGLGDCMDWRIDPTWRTRVSGVQGFIR